MGISNSGISISTTKTRYYHQVLEKYGIVILLVALIAVSASISPRFLTVENLINLSKQIVPLGLIALGAMFVLIAGGLDLSAGMGATMCGVSMGVVFFFTANPWFSVIASLVMGAIIGLFNSAIITRLGFSPVIATLAVMTILQGGIQLVLGGKTFFIDHPFFQYIGRGTIIGIPFAFVLLVLFYMIGYYLLNYTKFGVYCLAIGGNENNARIAGINIPTIRTLTYIISAICFSISGLVLVSRMAIVMPSISGFPLLLDGVSAAVIGGTSVTGGRGRVGGVFLGVIFIGIVTNALIFLNVPAEAQDLFRGLVIAFALIFERLTRAKEK